MNDKLNDAYAIAKYIKEAKKITPCKLYINGDFVNVRFEKVQSFGSDTSKILFGDIVDINNILSIYKDRITDYVIENDRRNSAIPLLDYTKIEARIEPGASIRDFVKIGRNVVVMMGAIINIGAEIGEKTMIDMNTVIGARAIIGRNCHIGAGSVVAGVLEPPSKEPVIIEDDVFVGANAVILEGVHIGKGAVVAAGSVVTSDVLENMVVAGAPAKVIKTKDEVTNAKTILLEDLRK
jgi:2,3,4,5-tetrahydropyridine-2,6-dicarboxylate N-acetyltransferase